MDTSALTAAVKPLARRGLLSIGPDPDDRRSRRLRITPEGVVLMRKAVEVWRTEHAALELALTPGTADHLRAGLGAICGEQL